MVSQGEAARGGRPRSLCPRGAAISQLSAAQRPSALNAALPAFPEPALHAHRPPVPGPHAVQRPAPAPTAADGSSPCPAWLWARPRAPQPGSRVAIIASEWSPAGGTGSPSPTGQRPAASAPSQPRGPGLPTVCAGASAGCAPSGHVRSGGSPSKVSCLSPACPMIEGVCQAVMPLPSPGPCHTPSSCVSHCPPVQKASVDAPVPWSTTCTLPAPPPPRPSALEPFGHTDFCTAAEPEHGHLDTRPVTARVVSGWAAAGGRSWPGLSPSGPPAASLRAPCPWGSAGIRPPRVAPSRWPLVLSAAGAAEPAGWTPHPASRCSPPARGRLSTPGQLTRVCVGHPISSFRETCEERWTSPPGFSDPYCDAFAV